MADTILWRRLDLPGHEIARLEARADGFELSGTALFLHDGRPCRLEYAVACDSAWRTVAARVRGATGDRAVGLDVAVDGERRWRLNGVEHTAVPGCLDIDLAFSPATNLLPIRRLALAVGEAAEVRTAWLTFPDLTFVPLPQVYRREGGSTYRYESDGGRFVRTLEVDATGFVTSYPGFWQAERT